MEKSTTILIVGTGTFGLSTAWHLARAGYTNIRCLDRWPVPSPSSAGYDLNKIVRTEYVDPIYTRLAHEAFHLWQEPLFKDVFHHTGWIWGTDGTTELGRVQAYDRSCQNTKLHGDSSKVIELPDWSTAVEKFPFLGYDRRHHERKQDFRAIFNKNAGWVDSVEAMRVLYRECCKLGVNFVHGKPGTVVSLKRREPSTAVCGVEAEDGTIWYADKIVLTVGAYSDTLLDFKSQLQATAYVVTHVRLTPEQYERYKDMPVIDISRRGYCFPPKKDRIMKICNTDFSYINIKDTKRPWGHHSIPRDGAYHPTDTQPWEAQQKTIEFTRWILSELTEAEIESSRLCWDMETFDYNWLIGYHPDSPESLMIATGGSGHSFKNMPNVGKYIVQAMEGKLDQELSELWKWRPDRIGKFPELEERARRPKLHLKDAKGWKHDSRL
ncbi:uncharacterized protein MYCFIDRAFT_46458 [Pseudocercospora fijiensis CIRAD86]|uniref:FAD dependent oxidoreductase domain-containing protein n=1 Tax=Pseudocercospora fijiensis (strain CIRAD86) TaxID=383855 RepID=M3ATR9_PSEFD|nr:uncharacterized protein MYCFIDRAFT_46458 [Pseudocercospora fijiensis CIRAD86]EME80877.1 hypothetical protein MYCFIDRAFT_46458 [Pseudocercospora fijiensis CIRAD86]